MARTRIVVDLSTGQQTAVPYTSEEEAAADAAYDEWLSVVSDAALNEQQKQDAKDEAAALVQSGDIEGAFSKLLELL
jgi:hypothetical protein